MMIIAAKPQDSSKVIATKGKIQEALFQQLMHKKIEQISIQEIADLAQINRGTFYHYFTDIYDLYQQVCDTYMSRMQAEIVKLMEQMIRYGTLTAEDTPVEFLFINQRELKILLWDAMLVRRVKGYVKENLRHWLQLPADQAEIDFLLEYLVSGQVTALSYWLENNMLTSVEKIFPLMRDVLFLGPLTVLFQHSPLAVNTAAL